MLSAVFVGVQPFGSSQSFKPVGGTINLDTVWTATNSPYSFTSNVMVPSGVTLTIQPGVVVNTNDFTLTVNGTLNAQGTSSSQIQFSNGTVELYGEASTISNCVIDTLTLGGGSPTISNSNIDTFNIYWGAPIINNNVIGELSPGWEIYHRGCTAVITQNAIRVIGGSAGSPTINNNVIKEGIMGYLDSKSMIISNNIIGAGILITGTSPQVINNTITDDIAVYGGVNINQGVEYHGDCGTAIIANNNILSTFIDSHSVYPGYRPPGIMLGGENGNAIITGNSIRGGNYGVWIIGKTTAEIADNYIQDQNFKADASGIAITSDTTVSIENNYISNTRNGILATSKPSLTVNNNTIVNNAYAMNLSCTAVVEQNNFGNYSLNSIYMQTGSGNVDATYNWWGTIDSAAISQSIFDHTKNSPSGTVTFTPYLTEPNPQAMPKSKPPTPIPQPTPSPATPKITRVQSYTNGSILKHDNFVDNGTGKLPDNYVFHYITLQTNATLNRAPQQGNVLIAAVGYSILVGSPATSNVSSITQSGVTWTRQVSQHANAYGQALEIWLGVVKQNADPKITISLGGTENIQAFITSYSICEYSGVATVNPLDQTAINSGFGSTSDTGQTAMTTKANELWVGAVLYYMSLPQTGVRNGFAQVGGDPIVTGGRQSTAILEKIVNEKGVANTGTVDAASPSNWGGCIATFFAANQLSVDNPSPTMDNVPKLQFSCQSTVSSIIRVNIKGTLTVNANGISDAPVLFSYSVNNGGSWIDFTTVNTDGAGGFSVLWMPSATGNYMVRGVWMGYAEYSAVNATVNFAIASYDAGSFFSINSNSTLSALSFDSATKQLSFTVNGSTGTTGYVEVYIPKSLLVDASNLKVKLDGNPIEYTYELQNDAWLITFTYHHSNHQVTMNLNSNSHSINNTVVGWILVAAILIPLAAVLVTVARQKNRTRRRSQTKES